MTLDASPFEETLPLYAPLPRPFMLHLLRHPTQRSPGTSLEDQVWYARHTLDLIMGPFARAGLSSQWVLKLLSIHTPGKSPVETNTFSLWRKRGLVRDLERGHPDPQNAAALIIARMIDDRERNWLPLEMAADEPDWWCWRQDAPDAPVLPCPYPLPDDLPASALLWTPWEGASWDRSWTGIELLGAARWAGKQQRSATVSHDVLTMWDPEVAALDIPQLKAAPLPREAAQEVIQAKAALALLRLALAQERLGKSRFGR